MQGQQLLYKIIEKAPSIIHKKNNKFGHQRGWSAIDWQKIILIWSR